MSKRLGTMTPCARQPSQLHFTTAHTCLHSLAPQMGGMVADILSRLPPEFDIAAVAARFPVSYEQSLNQVLCQEMQRYNRLTSVVRASLAGLQRALAGLQVMSLELDAVCRSMGAGQVRCACCVVSDMGPLACWFQEFEHVHWQPSVWMLLQLKGLATLGTSSSYNLQPAEV